MSRKREKTILHLDGDAFFVAVEMAKNPKLKGKPVVTGEERGIVTALSYEAKAFGIKRGIPIFQLRKQFPKVIVLPGDYKAYVRYSKNMFDIVRRYVDDVEEYSIDECFADLTGLDKPLKMSYKEIAEKIKKEIKTELDITVSVGVAPTKVLAKVASKWAKPNGLTLIEKKDIKKFLEKVLIEKIWGIGPQTSIFLKKKGLITALDFFEKELSWVHNNLSKPHEVIWRELKGEYIIEIDSKPKSGYSSIQKTRSFHPSTNNKVFLLSELSKNIEDACAKARYFKLFPQKVSFFLKDKNFAYAFTSVKLHTPTNAPEIINMLLDKEFKNIYTKGTPYRTTGVILSSLIPESVSQCDLFGYDKKASKFEIIHNQLDKLERKFGKKLVYLASTQKSLKNKRNETDNEDLDGDLLFL